MINWKFPWPSLIENATMSSDRIAGGIQIPPLNLRYPPNCNRQVDTDMWQSLMETEYCSALFKSELMS